MHFQPVLDNRSSEDGVKAIDIVRTVRCASRCQQLLPGGFYDARDFDLCREAFQHLQSAAQALGTELPKQEGVN